jgi:hypothetical protein
MPLMRNALHVMTGLYWDIGEGNTPYGQLERSIELARIRKC